MEINSASHSKKEREHLKLRNVWLDEGFWDRDLRSGSIKMKIWIWIHINLESLDALPS